MHPQGTEASCKGLFGLAAPGIKLLVAVTLITTTALLPRHADWLYLAPAGLLLLLWGLSAMPLKHVVRRLAVAEFFILGIGLLLLFNPAGRPIFFATLLKSNLCVLTLLWLTWTTSFQEILHILRRLGFPAVMLTTLTLMYRYVPLLMEESGRMQRARAARTFLHRRGPGWRSLSMIVGRLFVRSAQRAERIYLAMCARGWK